MSDYIKRKSIRDMYSCLDPNARVLVGQVLIDIDAIPTIDAVSVVRGEWIEQHENGHGFWVGVCSRCGEENLVDNYCPNCGADMRKGADEDEPQTEYERASEQREHDILYEPTYDLNNGSM